MQAGITRIIIHYTASKNAHDNNLLAPRCLNASDSLNRNPEDSDVSEYVEDREICPEADLVSR